MRIGRAAINHVRTKGPAILQVHTFRFNGHSPADPEHERNRKDEKSGRAECDPLRSSNSPRRDPGGLAACTAQRRRGAEGAGVCERDPAAATDARGSSEYPDPTGPSITRNGEPEMGLAKAREMTEGDRRPETPQPR